MQISIVVPAFNEEDSIAELVAEVRQVMVEHGYSWEMIYIDDGSTDKTWHNIRQQSRKHPEVKGIRFQRNYGKSAALHVGFEATLGDVVMTMDADLQDRPKHIPEFYKMITEEGYDLVSGWKQKRKDPITKTLPTKLYNFVNRTVSGIKLHDQNCGFKAYRKEVIKSIEVYGEMHRYIPVIAKAAGFRRIGELKVEHIARKHGKSKFGANRFINGFLDLLTITFITRYMKRPMHFFGFWGMISGMIGGAILFILYLLKFLGQVGLTDPFYVSGHVPALFFGAVALLMGFLLFSTGLLAELIGRNSPFRNEYAVAERIGEDSDDD